MSGFFGGQSLNTITEKVAVLCCSSFVRPGGMGCVYDLHYQPGDDHEFSDAANHAIGTGGHGFTRSTGRGDKATTRMVVEW